MQHDLKIHETRMSNARLVGWCICGGWFYDSENLDQGPMVREFVSHLNEIQPYVNFAQRHVVEDDGSIHSPVSL